MASHITSKTVDDATQAAGHAANKAGETIDANREAVADAIDEAADTVGQQGKKGPKAVKDYAESAKDKMGDAADYVRESDARQMGRDVVTYAREYPIASLFALGAVVIGGSILLAAFIDDEPGGLSEDERRPMGLSATVNSVGPKGTETLNKIRNAAFGFALAKAVEAAEDLWPGFKEHYEKA